MSTIRVVESRSILLLREVLDPLNPKDIAPQTAVVSAVQVLPARDTHMHHHQNEKPSQLWTGVLLPVAVMVLRAAILLDRG